MKRVLITGARGTLGPYIIQALSEKKYTILATYKKTLNVVNKKQVEKVFEEFKPHYVIHLAAITNVEFCEKNPKKAHVTNTQGTIHIAQACKKHDATLIFTSSSAVFKGKKTGTKETEPHSPVNYYGTTKTEAEKYILSHLKKFVILRSGWMIGGGRKEKKFISYIIADIRNNRKVKAVNDKFGTIAYAKELAEYIKSLIDIKSEYGIYHFGSKGFCTRYDMAKEIVKILKKKAIIQSVSSNAFRNVFFAPRPTYEILKSTKHIHNNTWRASLRNYIVGECMETIQKDSMY